MMAVAENTLREGKSAADTAAGMELTGNLSIGS